MTTLKDRIEARLRAAGLSPQAASMAAGLSRGAVRNILRERSAGANMKTLSALAPILGVTVDWLSNGGDNLPQTLTKANGQEGVTIQPSRALPVRYEVGAGYWVALNEYAENLGEGLVAPDPKYSQFPQWLERVIGDSMDKEYPAGTLVHVVDAIPLHYAPMHGDHVILEMTRRQGSEMERSVKEVVIGPRGVEFWPRSHNPRWQAPLVLADEAQGDAGAEIRVAGLVLGSYRPRRT